MEDKNNKNLAIFGIGVGVGLLSLWAIIEIAPILLLGGTGYLIVKGLTPSEKEE